MKMIKYYVHNQKLDNMFITTFYTECKEIDNKLNKKENMKMNRKIKNFKVLEKGYMLGSADIEVNDITIYNVRLMEKDGVRFLGFPSYKGNDGKYYKICNIKGETNKTLLGDMIDMYDTLKYEDLEPTYDNWNPID